MEQKKRTARTEKESPGKYDYSACGAYFITVCTANRQNYFWKGAPPIVGATSGRPQTNGFPAGITLTPYGEIVKEAICHIPLAYPTLSVESYVIMPNHLHLLLCFGSRRPLVAPTPENETAPGGRPLAAPTISRVIKQRKGYVSKKAGKSIWQKSFYDHIIRDREDFEEHLKYIHENPVRWYYDELYTE